MRLRHIVALFVPAALAGAVIPLDAWARRAIPVPFDDDIVPRAAAPSGGGVETAGRLSTADPACMRNGSSIHGTTWVDPGQSLSTFLYVVRVPDTAALGTVFFRVAIELGPQRFGLDTFIHVPPRAAAVTADGMPFAFAAPSPDPASAFTSFRFDLPEPDDVTLELFDLTGARVRTLVASRLPAGPNVRGWDLRDDAGRRVPAGVYLSRLTAGAWTQTRRVAVVR